MASDHGKSLNSPFGFGPRRVVLLLFALSWSLLLLGGGLLARHYWPTSAVWLWLLAAAVPFVAAIVLPNLARVLLVTVERLLRPVGEGVSLLLHALVFYLVFTPFAAVLRLRRWDPLRLRPGAGDSAWQRRSADRDYRWQY